MRLLVVVCAFAVLGVCMALPANAQVYVPPHVPMAIVGPSDMFEVPWWLGGFVATTNATANWTLPLTYPSGGKTNVGSALVIQNQGPYDIVLHTQAPETIQGMSSYTIIVGSTAIFLSSVNWILTSVQSTITGDINAVNASFTCNAVLGPYWNRSQISVLPECGTLFAERVVVGSTDPVGTYNSRTAKIVATKIATLDTTATDFDLGIFGTKFLVSGTTANMINSLLSENIICDNSSGCTLNNINTVYQQPYFQGPITLTGNLAAVAFRPIFASNSTGTVAFLRLFSFSTTANAGANVNLTTVEPYYASTCGGGGVTCLNYRPHRCDLSGGGTSVNSCFSTTERTGGTSNAAYHIDSNSATCGAGLVAGTAFDVCLYRGAAGVWSMQNSGGTGASLWVSKYLAVGATAAPSNTAAGAISTTKVSPALQAFGAVTASAASGVLAFTVSTGAASCATAVVTNTNVVVGSEVILTIQKYTGAYFTNGFPVVSREDTAGSSAGSFTLQLCNTHATNALSGNLYVAFWVLN